MAYFRMKNSPEFLPDSAFVTELTDADLDVVSAGYAAPSTIPRGNHTENDNPAAGPRCGVRCVLGAITSAIGGFITGYVVGFLDRP